MTERIAVTLDEATKAALHAFAVAEERSVSKYVERLLRVHVTEKQANKADRADVAAEAMRPDNSNASSGSPVLRRKRSF